MQQKPNKVRRFLWRFVKITVISLVLLLVVLYAVLQMHSVQTWLGKEISKKLSKDLHTAIAINAVRIDFFKTVHLEGVYVEDLHRDTLLYGNKLACEIAFLSFTKKRLELDLTHISDITFKLQKYKGEKDLNLQFLIDYFSGPKTPKDTTKSSFQIHYGDLKLSEVDFVYKDHNDTSHIAYGINFNDIETRHLSGKISDISINDDLIKCRVEELSLTEKSGLRVKKLYAEVTVSPKSIRADNMYLTTNRSYLHGFYQMHTDSWDSYGDFLDKVRLSAHLTDSSYVNPLDISYFTSFFKGFDRKIRISGMFDGPVSHLYARDLKFSVYDHTAFNGNFEIHGLPNVDSTFVRLDAKKLSTHYFDLVRVPMYPFDSGHTLTLPSNLRTLGLITFVGKTEGYLHNLFLSGVFNTSLGMVAANANVSTPADKEISYGGDFKTQKFNLGAFVGSSDLGEITLNAKIDGHGSTAKTTVVNIDGQVQACRYNNYVYHAINVNGSFKQQKFSGYFSSADSIANFKFVGNIDVSKKIPEMNANIDVYKFDLFRTHFFTSDSIGLFEGSFTANMRGQSIDDINGSLQATKVKLQRSNGLIKVDNTDIEISQDENHNSLSMISSILDAEVNGRFTSKTLPASLSHFLHSYFPTFFKEKIVARSGQRKMRPNSDNFKFKVRIKDIEPVATFFKLPLKISPNTIIQGSFDAPKNSLVVSGISDFIEYNKTPIREWFLSINTSDNKAVQVNTGFKKIDFGDSLYMGNFDLRLDAADNRSDFKITWDNQSKKKNAGEISGNMAFSQYYLDLDMQKFQIYTEDSLWRREGSDHLFADSSGMINFSDLTFINGNQRVKVEGVVSHNPQDEVVVDLDKVRLGQLNVLLKKKGTELDGTISGEAKISDIYKHFVFSSALTFDGLAVNNTLVGTGEINSFYDEIKKVVSINGFFKRDIGKISQSAYSNLNFDGYYYPSRKDSALDIKIHLDKFAISTLQPFVKDIFALKQGYLNGDIGIHGSLKKPLMSGELELAEVKGFKVDYLNAAYEIKQGKIKIEPDEITVDFITLYDLQGNKGVVYGNIFHDNFSNLKFDFDINVTNFMALNTTAQQNSSYYGRAYCTGNIGFYGPPDALNFEINAKTAKGTQFYIPLAGPGEVGDNGFIRFVKPDSAKQKQATTKNDFSGITLKFNLEATPNAEVQILLDPKSGDAIKARGIGNINMNISTHGNFEMFGTYDILDGSYLFTLENVINKKFDIDEGSTIRWSGDPLNADINITATYRQRTSLAAFFPQTTTASEQGATATGSSSSSSTTGIDNNKRYPVDCKLYMRDKLMSPDITFGIELPGVSEVIRSQVMGYINNEQELNRQVFSLLLLRTFVTPLQLTATSGVSAGDAVGNNASELLSNQINNWLSHFTKLFNMGVNYRPGGALSNEELDVNVSTQLFNDKLTIDGNVGVNNNTQTKTSTLIGDLNINYKLTHDGKVQLKAFNRSNDNFQIATLGGQFTQGAGVFYREEFNSLNDLYRRYINFLSRKKKKQPDTATATQ